MRGRVILVSMPFSALHYPSIGLGLLKPALAALDIACELRHFFLEFADRLGAESYDVMTAPGLYQSLAGEWAFAHAAHDRTESATRYDDGLSFLTEVIQAQFPNYFAPVPLHAILHARSEASAFINDCIEAVDWETYDIVGFTTSFQQNTASLALARRLKARFPKSLLVFGGANCRDKMGVALIERYPFIDAVCLGEGDQAFPRFAAAYLDGGVVENVPGMLMRRDGAVVPSPHLAHQIADLDSLPIPDFSDFFAQHAASSVASTRYPPVALFETSRGCWWGQKHHCSFCGINGSAMAFRSKSGDRALREIVELAELYGPDLVNVDAILDMRYFETLLPRLAKLPKPITAYYELKANLRPRHYRLLRAAGILKIQPGLESLDSVILSLMHKGCSAIQNVQTLKLAAEHGLYVEWNMLNGFPGETTEQYAGMKKLIPRLRHLQAPASVGKVRADRFSPYFSEPGRHQIAIRPNGGYSFVYPFSDSEIASLAYHFEIDIREPTTDPGTVTGVASECRTWQAVQSASSLGCRVYGSSVVVTDSRWGWTPTIHELSGPEAAVLQTAWTISSVRTICRDTAGVFSEEEVLEAVVHLDELGLVMIETDQIIALPLTCNKAGRALSWSEIRAMARDI